MIGQPMASASASVLPALFSLQPNHVLKQLTFHVLRAKIGHAFQGLVKSGDVMLPIHDDDPIRAKLQHGIQAFFRV